MVGRLIGGSETHMRMASGETEGDGGTKTKGMKANAMARTAGTKVKGMASMEGMKVKAMASTEGMKVEATAAAGGMAAVGLEVEGMAAGKI
jgi:hypothetical protein